MEINEQKREKFMENASKRVNNIMHSIQILEPMARSNSYDFTKEDVEEMFAALQETLDNAKEEFMKKFEGKAKSERKAFSFGQNRVITESASNEIRNENDVEENTENVEEIVNEVENGEENSAEYLSE